MSQYNTLINNAHVLIPTIISRVFLDKRQAFVPTDKVAPQTMRVLKSMDTTKICDYFLECLMLPVFEGRVSNTINLIRGKAITQFNFLTEIFQLEIFLQSTVDLDENFKIAHRDLIELFLLKPKERNSPNIQNYKKFLLSNLRKYKLSKNEVSQFLSDYIIFILSDSARKKVHMFEKRISSFILAFYQEIEPLSIFQVEHLKLNQYGFTQPFVILKSEILEEIKWIQQMKTKEQSWPSLLPLNKWSGKYPSFNYGGMLSNKFDKLNQLVHVKPHIILQDFIINRRLFSVINKLQEQPFKLNPIYHNIEKHENPYNLLWNKDVGYITQSISNIQHEINIQTQKLKVPTKDEMLEYKEIKQQIEIKFSNKSGILPKSNLVEFKAELFERTKHIFNADDICAYKTRKTLQKRLTSELSFLPKFDRIKIIYEVGFLDSMLYFEYFLDFRSRVYSSGWPIGLSNGYFKHLLIVGDACNIEITSSSKVNEFFELSP